MRWLSRPDTSLPPICICDCRTDAVAVDSVSSSGSVFHHFDSTERDCCRAAGFSRPSHSIRGIQTDPAATYPGIPTMYVTVAYTSQTCNQCSHIGYRDSGREFHCTHKECHVTTFEGDINGAINITQRADPWGKGIPLKPADDDLPRDGSAGDSTTVHTEQGQSEQMTLSEFGSKPTASDYLVFLCRKAAPFTARRMSRVFEPSLSGYGLAVWRPGMPARTGSRRGQKPVRRTHR